MKHLYKLNLIFIKIDCMTSKTVFPIESKKGVIIFNGRLYLQEEQKWRTGRWSGHGATPGRIRTSPFLPTEGRKGLAEAGPAPPWKRKRLVTEAETNY
jgi:hypothetical protein